MASIEELVSKDLNENHIFADLADQRERLRTLEEYGGIYHQVIRAEADIDVLSSINIIAGSGLVGGGVLTGDVTLMLGDPGTLSVSSTDAVTSSSHTHAINTSSNPGAAASILASDASGHLQLKRLGLDVSPTVPLHIRSGTIPQLRLEYNASETAYLQTSGSGDLRLYSSGDLELYPDGNILVNPVGNYVSPVNTYDVNLGSIGKKYLSLHAAELWVSTLVAQDVLATIGGRVVVAPTTKLAADLGDQVGDTTISVEHNNLSAGDIVYLESFESSTAKVEFMLVTSGYTGSGPYSYTVERDLDGTGRNPWYAGDAILNTGRGGDGFIDLYSVSGIADSSAFGPTIVGNVRANTNLVTDPGFENVSAGPDWESWTEYTLPDSSYLYDETTNVHSGSHAVRARTLTFSAYVSQQINVTPGTKYILTFWTRGDGSVAGRYAIIDRSNVAYILNVTSTGVSGTTYTNIGYSFTAPAGCSLIEIYFYSPSSSGSAYFDDAYLYEVDYSAWTEHWAIGNLNGLYGASSDVYGVGLGRPDKAYVLIDDTDGVTIRDSIGTKLIQLDVSGNAIFGNVATDHANVLWNNTDNRLEFRGGASGTTVQAYIDDDGAFVAGSITDRDVVLDQSGLTLIMQPQTYVTGGKSIDFYSSTDSKNMAMITANRYATGGDQYVQLRLQAADDLTNGVNHTGHSNPMLTVGWDQYGRSGGAVDVINAALIVGGPSFSDISPAVAGNVYAGNDLYAVNNIITATGSAKIGNGAVIGSSSASPGYGDLRVGGGIYVGATTTDAATGNVQITADFISNNGGIGLGNSGFNPGNGQIMWDCRTAGAGLRPWDGGTYHQAFGYVPLNNYISYAEAATLTSTGTNASIVWPSSIPYYAKALAVTLNIKCTVAGGWVSLHPGTSGTAQYHLTTYTHVANMYNQNDGIVYVAGDAGRDQRLSWNAQGGTITYYLRCVGYFI